MTDYNDTGRTVQLLTRYMKNGKGIHGYLLTDTYEFVFDVRDLMMNPDTFQLDRILPQQ
jgi:hypothetical protein